MCFLSVILIGVDLRFAFIHRWVVMYLFYKMLCNPALVRLCHRSFDDEVLVHNNSMDYETFFENALYSIPENATAFGSGYYYGFVHFICCSGHYWR